MRDRSCALKMCIRDSPISVDEYTYGELEEPRINKVYQLSLSDDPSLIPTEDFERDGLWFTLLDMTRKNEVGVDTPVSYTHLDGYKRQARAMIRKVDRDELLQTLVKYYLTHLSLIHICALWSGGRR